MKAQLQLLKIFNPPNYLNDFEIQKYYQNEPKFSVVYLRNNLPKIKEGAYIINLDDFKSIGALRIVFYVNSNNATYIGSFGVEQIPKEIKACTGNENIITNIYGIQAYNSVICGYFCIGFIDFMLKDKSLLDYTNLFSPNEYEKNDKTIVKCFH